MNLASLFTVIGFLFLAILLAVILIVCLYLYFIDRNQKQHPVLRNYPLVGRARYFLETIGPELRQYLFDSDLEGKPFSRVEYQHVVKQAKYKRDVVGFGSRRDFEKPGYYIRNTMFPKLAEELKMDRNEKVNTHRYLLINEPLFTQRKEKWEQHESLAYLLNDEDAIVIGPNLKHPFVVKGQIGMSGMSYGALGERA